MRLHSFFLFVFENIMLTKSDKNSIILVFNKTNEQIVIVFAN